jgi:hypothetical protein
MRRGAGPADDDLVAIDQQSSLVKTGVGKHFPERRDRLSRIISPNDITATHRATRVGVAHVVGRDKIFEFVELPFV